MRYTTTVGKYRVGGAFAIEEEDHSYDYKLNKHLMRRHKNGDIWAFYRVYFFAQVYDLESGELSIEPSQLRAMSSRNKKEFVNSDYPMGMILNAISDTVKNEQIANQISRELLEQVRGKASFTNDRAAFCSLNGDIQMWTNDDWAFHREDGPAFISGSIKLWYLNGKRMKKNNFSSIQMIERIGAAELFTTTELIEIMARG